MWRHYLFTMIRHGIKEWGITSADNPDKALQNVLGSHPKSYGVTYVMVYLNEDADPNSDFTREWGEL